MEAGISFWLMQAMCAGEIIPRASHPLAMLTEIYIEALLVDEELADLVWED